MLSLFVLAPLAACGATVSPSDDASMRPSDSGAVPSDGAITPDVTQDAATQGEVIDSLVALATTTYAVDVHGRAYGWGFIHFEGNGEYREPHRIPQLDGMRSLRSAESLFTCAIFNNELRCSALNQPFRRIPWADDLVDYGITTSPLQLWVLGRDGRVRFSAPRQPVDLARLPDAAHDGEIVLTHPAQYLDCQRSVCCSAGPSFLQCWGQSQSTFRSPPVFPIAVTLGDASRVFFSRTSETLCQLAHDGSPSCWGPGVYQAFGLRRTSPQLEAPESPCSSGTNTPAVCVSPPGLALPQLHFVASVTNNSSQIVLGFGDQWAVEGSPAPWATSLSPTPLAVSPRTTSTMTVLRGLDVGSRLSVGGSHACWTRDLNRRIFCAGSNFAAQLGIDRRQQHDDHTPVEVRLPE